MSAVEHRAHAGLRAEPARRPRAPTLRVLQLGKYYAPYRGGIEHHLEMLCAELVRRGDVEMDVVVCNSERAQRTELVDGVRVTRCFELTKVASTSICPTMPVDIVRRRADIVHIHYPHPMGVMSYLAAYPRKTHGLVVTYHSDIVRQARLLRLYRPFMDRVLARADAVIVGSPAYAESSRVLEQFRDKCRVIPFAVDLADAAQTPELERSIAALRARHHGRRLVLAVGRLVYYKGFDYLISAMRHVDATLLLVGEGPLRVRLERLARESGVADRVLFLGEVDAATLRACYAACDVFALSSIERSEAFAIVQLEAMLHGRPVVNTAIPGSGVPWVSRDGESGLTVAPKEPEALAAAINRVLGDPALAARLGAGGRARVEVDFSKELMAGRTEALYRSLLSS